MYSNQKSMPHWLPRLPAGVAAAWPSSTAPFDEFMFCKPEPSSLTFAALPSSTSLGKNKSTVVKLAERFWVIGSIVVKEAQGSAGLCVGKSEVCPLQLVEVSVYDTVTFGASTIPVACVNNVCKLKCMQLFFCLGGI